MPSKKDVKLLLAGVGLWDRTQRSYHNHGVLELINPAYLHCFFSSLSLSLSLSLFISFSLFLSFSPIPTRNSLSVFIYVLYLSKIPIATPIPMCISIHSSIMTGPKHRQVNLCLGDIGKANWDAQCQAWKCTWVP